MALARQSFSLISRNRPCLAPSSRHDSLLSLTYIEPMNTFTPVRSPVWSAKSSRANRAGPIEPD
jgi:hypothetical protein